MIGNDIIDIIQSRKESNWQRPGFLKKIFTTEEQLFINDYINNEIMIWRLWSMKEAAYKIYNRQTKVRAFIPHKLSCTIIDSDYGTVTCNGYIYYTKTSTDFDSIYTVASVDKDALDTILELADNAIIKDIHNHPFVYNKQQKILQPVSVTHHGRYYKIAALGK